MLDLILATINFFIGIFFAYLGAKGIHHLVTQGKRNYIANTVHHSSPLIKRGMVIDTKTGHLHEEISYNDKFGKG